MERVDVLTRSQTALPYHYLYSPYHRSFLLSPKKKEEKEKRKNGGTGEKGLVRQFYPFFSCGDTATHMHHHPTLPTIISRIADRQD